MLKVHVDAFLCFQLYSKLTNTIFKIVEQGLIQEFLKGGGCHTP